MQTECCNYNVPEGERGPVFCNPFNNVVQCHACGAVYTSARKWRSVEEAPEKPGYYIGKFAPGSRNAVGPIWWTGKKFGPVGQRVPVEVITHWQPLPQ